MKKRNTSSYLHDDKPVAKTRTPQKPVVAAVIAAGGVGTRLNSATPKQFLEIAGKPILLYSVETISLMEEVTHIIVAIPREFLPQAEQLLNRYALQAKVECVAGGKSRQESVYHGVVRVGPEVDVIMVHDAARPLCELETMRRVLKAAWEHGAAVPGLPATDTIKRVSRQMRILATPARAELYVIQTPQAFHAHILRSALDQARKSGLSATDESSVVHRAGYPVVVVEGSPENIKITHPWDLALAELLIKGKSQVRTGSTMTRHGMRIGHGIDYHRLVRGRKLILGGVELPFEKGLEGYSDADALAHAVCDALLGAAGLGDIGRHFPDSDPSNLNRCSLEFLQEVRKRIEAAGWEIRNIDATLLLQKPKISPFVPAMRENIARSLGIDSADVNIKATTTEEMNAEGRGEGVSAQAVALLQRK